jgi:hypothetical protein
VKLPQSAADMPDLQRVLQGNDLGFLKIVAGAWGIELNAPDAHTGLPMLVGSLLNPAIVNEVVEALPADAQQALQALIQNEGRMPWAHFARRFGDVRAMGAARRDRERPDLRPVSPAEILWYRALVGKAFLNTANAAPEPQEYAYIPEDLLDLMNPRASSAEDPLGRAASPGESAHVIPTTDRILDHACTLLSALRMKMSLEKVDAAHWGIPQRVLQALLYSARLLDSKQMPIPEPARAFLEAPRAQALTGLAHNWMESSSFNDLRHLPGLGFEGEWRNDPLLARKAVLDLLSRLPEDRWWNIASFVQGIAENQPDFQRPAGDYDSWFIRRESDGVFLRGFSTWDEVDGALVRFLITGPLHWLGFFDLASPAPGTPPTAFRPSAWAAALWHGSAPQGLPIENGTLKVNAEGQIRLSPLVPRASRYQIARFCEWLGEGEPAKPEYRYRVTPAALDRARENGLRTTHLVSLLRKHAAGPIPPTLLQALERWEKFGSQAKVEKQTLLRVASPEILTALRQSKAGRYLGEALTPTTVILKPGADEAVARALADIGYLSDKST